MGLQSPLDPITVSLSLVSLIADIIGNLTSFHERKHEIFIKKNGCFEYNGKHLSIPILLPIIYKITDFLMLNIYL